MHIRSVLQKGFVGEVKVYLQCSTVLKQGGVTVFTSSKNGFLYLKIQPDFFCYVSQVKNLLQKFLLDLHMSLTSMPGCNFKFSVID